MLFRSFILFQTIPDKLIAIFGSVEEKYIEFACLAFRTYLMLCIFNGVQIPSGIFFQAIGKSVISAILSVSRQIVLLIPAMIILGNIFGVHGVLSAGPIADGIAFMIALILIIREVRKLGKRSQESQVLESDTVVEAKSENKIVVTVSRERSEERR